MAKDFSEMVFSRDLQAPLVKRGQLWREVGQSVSVGESAWSSGGPADFEGDGPEEVEADLKADPLADD